MLKKAQQALLLNHFGDIAIEYYEGGKDDGSSYAECVNYDPYVSVCVRISSQLLLDFKKKTKLKSIKDTLIHEMCHPLTDPLFNVGMDRFLTKDNLKKEREKLTDHIANIVIHHELV